MAILDWWFNMIPIAVPSAAKGWLFLPLDSIANMPGGIPSSIAGTYPLDFIFFVVDEAHKDTPITEIEQVFSQMPMTGEFSFTIKATFEKPGFIPLPEEVDPTPEPGPLTLDQNYISVSKMINESGTKSIKQIEYFDGLGRPVQSVQVGIPPSGNDLVSIGQYDGFGREARIWLPTVIENNNGIYVNPNIVMSKAKSNYNNDAKPYSFSVYESSALNKVLEQYGPGVAWHENQKSNHIKYYSNTSETGLLSCIKYFLNEPILNDTLLIQVEIMEVDYCLLLVLKTKKEVLFLNLKID